MEQLDQSGYELRKLHGSNTNAKYGLNKTSKKKKKKKKNCEWTF